MKRRFYVNNSLESVSAPQLPQCSFHGVNSYWLYFRYHLRALPLTALGGLLRYRTAATVSVLVVIVMFGIPATVEAFLLPRLSNPVPFYQQSILGFAVFCLRWRVLLLLPLTVLPFVVAAFTPNRGR